MTSLLWKRFKLLFYIMLMASLLLNSFIIFNKEEQFSHTQEEFDSYISIIENQSYNIGGISIFEDYDSYDIKKINKTFSIYNNIRDTVIVQNDTNTNYNMLSDEFIFGFTLFVLFYELYIFVYDKDKGYDHLIKTLYNGKRRYYLWKLTYVLKTTIYIYIVNLIFALLCSVFIHKVDLFHSIQSVYGYIHCWYDGNILSYFLMISSYRMIWLIMIIIIAPIIYVKINDIYIALIRMIGVVLFFIIVNMVNNIKNIGLIYQISSLYFKELYLMNVFNIPMYTVNISIIIFFIITILIHCITLKFNGEIYEAKKISKYKINTNKFRYHNNFYYEGKKIFICNGFLLITIIVIMFQGIHYVLKEPINNEANVYYSQYMNYLEGEYTLEKEEYLKQEGQKYKEMEERMNELVLIEYSSASIQNELQTLQYNLRGKYSYDLVLERAEYIKQTPGAMFFNDLSLYYICNNLFDNVLDFLVYLCAVIIFVFLLQYEEKKFNMNEFLKTLPFHKKILKNKQIYIFVVAFAFSLLSIVIRIFYYSANYGSFTFNFPANSVPYLSTFNINILTFFGLLFIVSFFIYYIISFIIFRLLVNNN